MKGVCALAGGDIILHNSADIGWTASTAGNSAVNGSGVFLTAAGTTLTMVDDSGVQYNTASSDGGGIHVTDGASVLTDSALVNNNQAAQRGGGIMVDTSATVTIQNGSTINDNQATSASAIGGGLYIYDQSAGESATVAINSSHVDYNISAWWYGGIRLYGSSTLNLNIGTTVSSNQAQTASGGGLGLYEGTINLNDSAIQSNTAAVNGGGIIVEGWRHRSLQRHRYRSPEPVHQQRWRRE